MDDMVRKVFRLTMCVSLFLLVLGPSARACPLFEGLVDFNCDQDLRIGFTGDSIVKGVGDSVNNGDGGYVLRLGTLFPAATFSNIGVAGTTTPQLYAGFKQNLAKIGDSITKEKTRDLDLLIIDVGRNDYWMQLHPAVTVRNIKRLVKLLRTELSRDGRIAPLIAVAALIPSIREKEAPFVAEVNRLLLEQASSALPVMIRFDKMPETILSEDGLHPSSEGYDELAAVLRRYLIGPFQTKMHSFRLDLDKDGVYDLFEPLFGTSPNRRDSEGDGLPDGQELFRYFTDPFNPDTDFDGVNDVAEVAKGTDPLIAGDGLGEYGEN